MKTLKIILLLILMNLFVGCKSDDDEECERIKSIYISNFLGEYAITENYIHTQIVEFDDKGEPIIDTIKNTICYYTLIIEQTKNKCYDIQLKAPYESINYFDTPLQATIFNDSTFFFYEKFPAYDSYGVINGNGSINIVYAPPYHTTTIKINYKKGGPNQYGEHNWSATGIKL